MITAVEERADELKGLCLTYGVRRLDLFGSALDESVRSGRE